MIATEIAKTINGLKTNTDKLSPKPSDAFVKVYKADSNSVLAAAKSFDRAVAVGDKGDPKEDYVDLKRTISKYFGELLKLAGKEPNLINVKLQKYVNAAEKNALKITDDEYEDFLKVEATESDKSNPKLMDAMLEALKQRASAAERGQKAAKAYRAEAEKTFTAIKANRAKGGEEALAESLKLLFDLRVSETEAAHDKDFAKGRKPLKPEHLALLKQARQNEATKLKLESEQAANTSERIMDAGRDFRVAALKEIHAHQDAVEKANAAAAKDEKNQDAQLKKIETDFNKLTTDSTLVLERTSKESWKVVPRMIESNAERPYREFVAETSEAFRTLPKMNTKLLALNKQVGVLRGLLETKEGKTKAADLRNKIVSLQMKFRTAHFAEADYNKLLADSDKEWQKRDQTTGQRA